MGEGHTDRYLAVLRDERTGKKLEIGADAFVWKPLFVNNMPENKPEFGEYALLFKEHGGKVVGYKFSIVYQRREASPLCYAMPDAEIERYNLFEQRYDDVKEPLEVTNTNRDFGSMADVDGSCTLNEYSANDPGRFVRTFVSMEEAKNYALENLVDRV